MVIFAAQHRDPWAIVACSIYGASLVLLYLSSTLYHALTHPGAKRVFLILDHAMIYVLIAGTYTPFTLVSLRGGWGWTLFGIVWGLAFAGIVFQSFFVGRMRILSTALYVVMGWFVMIAIYPLVGVLHWDGFLWLLAGGLAYTGGVVFFASKRRFAHSVWHLFVVMGSGCHFWAVWRYVLKAA
jgi:hemolysin III